MPSFAIQAFGLRKRYRLGASPARAADHSRDLWALDGVDFEIHPGEVVGILGRNGAGKSTLLKVLSRITAPTEGSVEIHGSMASLLEVGTGFHPELTGRENIYLNGAILGMSRKSIARNFDAIVEFSELHRFIDTPVKRYSSGMYVRLAFSVAAHLDPDILLIDEILAVGDGAFQKKCLGRLRDSAQSGRTVVFVSHNLPMIRTLCSRVLLMEHGRITDDGAPDRILSAYNRALQTPRDISREGMANRLLKTTGAVRIEKVGAIDECGEVSWNVREGGDVRLQIDYRIHREISGLGIYLTLTSQASGEIVTTIKERIAIAQSPAEQARRFEIMLPRLPLRAGDYLVSLTLSDEEFGRIFDIVDKNQDLPWLTVSSDERDPQRALGYVTIPSQIISANSPSLD